MRRLGGRRRAVDRSDVHSYQGSPGEIQRLPIFCSIDQAAVQGRQEGIVENIRRGGPLLEFEILGDLIDRPFEAGRIDAADAVALDFAGEDVVADHGAQAIEFEIARSGSLIAIWVPAITARRKPFTASGFAAANAGLTMTATP